MSLPSRSDLTTMGYVSRAIGYVDQPASSTVTLTTAGYVSRALPFFGANGSGSVIVPMLMLLGIGS